MIIGSDIAAQTKFFQSLAMSSDRILFDLTSIFSRSESINLAEKGHNPKHLHSKTKTGKSNVNFYKSPIECFRSPSVAHISEIRNKHSSSGGADLSGVLTREFSCEDHILTACMGGELGDFISRLSGSSYKCIGTMPIHSETVTTWDGSPHSGGLADGIGYRWWAYQKCRASGYQTAWWKVERLLVSKSIEEQPDSSRVKRDNGKTMIVAVDIKRDYYRLLCVEPDANLEEIKKNYRYLVRRFHPDLAKVQQLRELETLKSINEAYEALSDLQTRLQYDRSIAKSRTR